MGAENWALFKMPSDEDSDPVRCELCQLFLSGYVTGVEQLLQLALWLDRQTRFGKKNDSSEIIVKIEAHTAEVAKLWVNYWGHYITHAKQGHPAGS